MKKIYFIIICLLTLHTSFAQTQPGKKDVKKLLLLMGTDKLSQQVIDNMIVSFKQSAPEVPDKVWTKLAKKIDINELVDLQVDIYAKHYSAIEVQQLISFYTSPLGKKVTATLPIITQESYQVGEAWGKKVGEQVVAELKKEGYFKE